MGRSNWPYPSLRHFFARSLFFRVSTQFFIGRRNLLLLSGGGGRRVDQLQWLFFGWSLWHIEFFDDAVVFSEAGLFLCDLPRLESSKKEGKNDLGRFSREEGLQLLTN
jgi:hypothetical protein